MTTKQIVACASYLGLSSAIALTAAGFAYKPPATRENVMTSIAVGTSAFLIWPWVTLKIISHEILKPCDCREND